MARLTLTQFNKGLATLNARVIQNLLVAWTRETVNTLDAAQEIAPLASGNLVNSGSFVKAKVTRKGIVSKIIFKAPYAAKLNNPKSGLNLKSAGELSYRIKGRKVFKARKGVLGFLTKSVDDSKDIFIDTVKKAVGRAWDKI